MKKKQLERLKKRIGNAARRARVSLGYTQEDAAEEIGVTVEYYARIERGTSLPSLRKFLRIAFAFGLSTDQMLGLTENAEAQRILEELASRAILLDLQNGDGERVFVLPPPMAGFFEFSMMRAHDMFDKLAVAKAMDAYMHGDDLAVHARGVVDHHDDIDRAHRL